MEKKTTRIPLFTSSHYIKQLNQCQDADLDPRIALAQMDPDFGHEHFYLGFCSDFLKGKKNFQIMLFFFSQFMLTLDEPCSV